MKRWSICRFVSMGMVSIAMCACGGSTIAETQQPPNSVSDAGADAMRISIALGARPDPTFSPARPLVADGSSCDDALALDLPANVSGETPLDGIANHLCATSDAPQRFYSFTLPAHQRAVVTATPSPSTQHLVLRAMASCDATDCLTDDESSPMGGPVTVVIDSPGDEPLTKIVTVSGADAMSPAVPFTLSVRLESISGCRVTPRPGIALAYTPIEMPPLDGDDASYGIAVNNNGQAIVRSQTNDAMRIRSFVWDHGVRTEITGFGGSSTVAVAINDAGVVVGWGYTPDAHSRAFRWYRGELTDLGAFGNPDGIAAAVNTRGLIAGYSPTGNMHTFLWNAGMTTDLFELGGGAPSALNDRDQLVGALLTTRGEQHAYLWDAGVVTDLGAPGALASNAVDIANDGTIVGWLYNGGNDFRAFRWRDGVMSIPARPAAFLSTSANAINDLGWMVGAASTSNDVVAFIDDGSGMRPLVDALVPGSGWGGIFGAGDVNDCGEIVGSGGHFGVRAVLLEPMEIACSGAGQLVCGTHCVDSISDPANCGACGSVCASDRCEAGGCICAASEECGNGRDDDCNGQVDDGCACAMGTVRCGNRCVDVASDGMNCGACGVVCSGGARCGGGRCGL